MTGECGSQRFVIASLGSIGQRHLRNLRGMRPHAVIAALRRPDAGMDIPEGCDTCLVTIDDALAFRPAAAILAGPAPTHVPLAQAFVDAGIPVLIEKPLSHDLAGLAELAAAAARRSVPVMIGYNLRFNPSLQAMRDALLAEAIGEVLAVRAEVGQYLPDWRPQSDYRCAVSARQALGGGALLELSHEIDYIYWLFGMPDRVTCRGGRMSTLDIDVEDCVELCLEYDAPRRLVSIHLDFLQRPASRQCKLIGTKGTILWDGMSDRYVITPGDPAGPPQSVDIPVADRNKMYLDELSAFLAVVDGTSMPPISLREGIDIMRIVDAARRSMTNGHVTTPAPWETGS